MTDPPWGDKPPQSAKEALGSLWRAGRDAATKKKEVAEAVRAQSHGKSRHERRILFERELDRQQVPRDPIWVERQLDELELSASERPGKRAKEILMAAGTLPRLIGGTPDLPAWMTLPEDAGRPVWKSQREKTAIQILPDASEWLDRALAEAPQRVGREIALFDVWFDWKPGMSAREPITVHLGAHKIGMLDPQATQRLISHLEGIRFVQAKPYNR